MKYRIEHYVTRQGRDPYINWLQSLRDRIAKISVIRRVARIEQGNFGDHRYCRDSIWELRIDTGPGYRVYYTYTQQQEVLLLCAGSKHTQTKDITQAVFYLNDWQTRDLHA